MIPLNKRNLNPIWFVAILSAAVFLFLAYFDQYRLYYLEQIQLFRFSLDYFTEFLNRPGGIAEYFGAFLTQFFLIPLVGPAVVTLIGAATYFVTAALFRKFNISGIAWSYLPVLMLIAVQQYYLYKLGFSIGLLISLIYIDLCLSIKNERVRNIAGMGGLVILYPVTGVFSVLAPVIFILDELFQNRNKYRYAIIGGYAFTVFIIPYFYWQYIYYIPFGEAFLTPLPGIFKVTRIILILLMVYFPFFILTARYISAKLKKPFLDLNTGWENIIAGVILLVAVSGLLIKYSSDPNTERILKIDHYIQSEQWEKALDQCYRYPEPNRMVVYFTNLSLLKSGHLGDQMFHYRQAGLSGLSLPWASNNLIPFFGCEIFYHLGYFSEAYRWAFEAMEVNGQCPRLLKRLIMTSLINGDIKIAEKFLNQLGQSLFYREWTEHYLELASKPELLKQEREISEKRELLIQDDFFAGLDNTQLGLSKLLENKPHNKPVYEYYMASLLLSKDIVTFAKEIGRLKEFGYKVIPVHFEEAILWYMGYSKQNIVPAGFNIRKSTLEKFKSFAYSFPRSSGSSIPGPKLLESEFGTTFWYYYHFNNNQ